MIKISPYSFLLLITAFCSQSAFAVICEFEITNEWNSGYTASITLYNDTQSQVDGWTATIEFTDATTVSHFWNASITSQPPYQASHKSYNKTIQPGGSINFGFNAKKSIAGAAAQAPILGGICDNENGNHSPQAIATASTTQGTIPLTIDFSSDASTDQDGDVLSYLWQFEDGTSISEPNPSRTFSKAGEYSVTLTVHDGELSSSTTLSILAQLPQPESAECQFNINNEWGSGFTSSIEITNVSEQAITAWTASIDFPNNSANITQMWNADLMGQNPYQASNKSYNGRIDPGSSVSFGFNSNKSTQGASVQTPILGGICDDGNLNINTPPEIIASVLPNTGTIPLVTVFDASQSVDVDDDELSFYWDFGNGQTSTDAVANHTYLDAGNYRVTLTLTDSHEATDIEQFSVIAQEPVTNHSYTLDSESSSLFFVSTKNVHVIETHTFTDITGEISSAGEVVVFVNLNSVESGIDIRNERLRELLFETSQFNTAAATMSLDLATIDAIPIGEVSELSLSVQASLHGINTDLLVQISVTRLTADTLLIQNLAPLLLHVEDFNLGAGVEALKELAGLDVISYSVPVNFTLIFNQQ